VTQSESDGLRPWLWLLGEALLFFLILAALNGGLGASPLHRTDRAMEPWRLAAAIPLCLATIIFASRGRADRVRAWSLIVTALIPLVFNIVLPAGAGLRYLFSAAFSTAELAFEALMSVAVFAWLILIGSTLQVLRDPASPPAARWTEGSGVALTLASISAGLLAMVAEIPPGGPNVLRTAALLLGLASGLTAARIRTLQSSVSKRIRTVLWYAMGAGLTWLLADLWLVIGHLGGWDPENHRIAKAGLMELPILYIPVVLFSASVSEAFRLAHPTPPPTSP